MSKPLVILIVSIALSACGGGGSSSGSGADESVSVRDLNLSGTWHVVEEHQRYKVSTGEYLYSNYSETPLIFEETNSGLKWAACRDWSFRDSYAVKTDAHLYLNVTEVGFEPRGNNTFMRTYEYDANSSDDIVDQVTETLVKVSDVADVDYGEFSVTVPFSVDEQDHVCVTLYYSDLGSVVAYELEIPYGSDDRISFNLTMDENLPVGTYVDDRYLSIDQDLYVYWISSDLQDMGYDMSPDVFNVTMTEHSTAAVSGTFTYVGIDANTYTGAFTYDLTRFE